MSVVNDTTETAPAVLNASGSGAASYTSVMITPSGARTISGAIVAGSPMIDFNGADNVTIDGLNSAGNSLTLSNTTVSATSITSTIRFIGGATGNTITNSTVLGAGSMSVATNGATIFFSTDAVTANGNDNNTISNNNIGAAASGLPTKGILCNGSTTTTALGNSGITVNNNNIFDYFGAAVTSSGLAINGGCNTWTITGNRFYQTATRTWTTGATHRAIDINNSTAPGGAQGFTITGNTIGFASNTQTGVYTLTGSTGKFVGIFYSGITAGLPTSISNNTIAAVNLSGVTSSGTGTTGTPFAAIIAANGLITSNANQIGSQSATGSLVFSTNTTLSTDMYGIYNFSSDISVANDNAIGGMSLSNAGATGAFIFYGIRANTGATLAFNAQNNLVGGTVANSIANNSASTTAQSIGILTTLGVANLRGNIVRNITAAGGTGSSASASVIGLGFVSTTAVGHNVEANTISALANTNAAAVTTVAGIQFTSGTTTASTIQRNLLHSLNNASGTGIINGINISGGLLVFRNNMIRLGLDTVGAPITAGVAISGINEFLGTNTVFNNSVLISGAGVGGTANTFAFNGQQTVNTRSFQNNNFINTRGNAAGTGKHYAIRVGGTTPNPTGLTSNYNNVFVSGAGGVLGLFNAIDQTSLPQWQAATGQDANSLAVDPVFNSPNDLHLTAGSPARDVGLVIASVTNDFDGDGRPGANMLYDIGADEFDGTPPVPNDMQATAFIDPTNGGVKLAGAAVSPQASFTNNGTNAQTNVLVRYRILDAGLAEVYNQTTLIASIAAGATANATFPAATINTAGSYSLRARSELGTDTVPANDEVSGTVTIAAPLAGAVTVGAGGQYLSLTNSGGLFQALNNLGATANVSATLIGDSLAETGTVALNQVAGGFTLRIQPQGARTISGSATVALIDLNGADGVTIDGLNTGGNSLLIRNTGTGSAPTIRLVNDASNNAFLNCMIESGGTGTAINISTGTVTGNDDNSFVGNVLRDRTDAVGVPFNGIGSTSASTTITNGNLLIENNQILNFNQAGIFIGVGSENVTIRNNDISQSAVRTTAVIGIAVNGMFGTNLITLNRIRDLAASGAVATTGMILNDARDTTVSRNRIYNFNSVAGATGNITGIQSNGSSTGTPSINLINNMITLAPTVATAQTIRGIYDFGFANNTVSASYNSIYVAGTASGSASSWALLRGDAAPTAFSARNNIAYNNRTGGTGNHFAGGDQSANTGTFTSNYNFFAGTGATAANLMDYGTSAAGTPVSFAAWQAGPPTRDANSTAGVASGFVANDFFVDTVAGDLHLKITATPVINTGIPIAGITTDFDGDTRSATAPEIGADEIATYTAGGTVSGLVGTGLVLQNNAGDNLSVSANGGFTFATALNPGAAYSVTVLTQPNTPIQTCVVSNGSGTVTSANITNVSVVCTTSTFTVGGTVSGLAGSGLVFANNGGDNFAVAANGAFAFATPINSGATYAVTVLTQPSAPTQSCVVSNGSGTVTSANITNVSVVCTTSTFTVGGTVSGLAGSGLVLANNGGDNFAVAADGAFAFATPVNSGATYAVAVLTQPSAPTQNCVVSNGSGTVTTANITNVSVVCTTTTFTVGGTVSGLAGTGLVLRNNGGDNLAVSANGGFTFATALNNGAAYAVTVSAQPSSPSQSCVVSNGSGTIAGANISTVVVSCTTNTFTVGGTVTGLSGTGLVLRNNSGDNLAVAANGAFTFATSVNDGGGYAVTVFAQPTGPAQICVVGNGTGTIAGANISSITVSCSTSNSAPTITAAALTRRAGNAGSNATIANVSDAEQPADTLTVTVDGGASATVNGVTISGLATSAAGVVSANAIAACGATSASFMLRATDAGALFTEATLAVTVDPNLPPTLTYSAANAVFGQSISVNPATGPTDSGSVTSVAVQSPGSYTGSVSVTPAGVVSLGNAAPAGAHTIVIRATDNCAATTDANLALTVGQAATTTVINANLPNPSFAGQNVVVTYAVTANAPSTATPVGMVTVSDGVDSCTATVAAGQCTVALSTVGNRTLTATYAGTSNFAGSSATTPHGVSPTANLSVTKVATETMIGSGILQYTITVANAGPSAATGVMLTDTFPAQLTGAMWTCSGVSGGTCMASGTGNISQSVNLPSGASVVFSITANIVMPLPASISNTASISVPAGLIDPNLGNNTSTATTVIVIFANGFEAAAPVAPSATKLQVAPGASSSMLLPLLDVKALGQGATPTEVIRFEVQNSLVVVQSRRLGGDVQVRTVQIDGPGNWATSAWQSLDQAKSLVFEWTGGMTGTPQTGLRAQ